MKNYDDVPDRYDDEILEAEPADDEYDEVIDGEYDYDRDDSDYKFGRVLDEISEIRRNMDADDRRASGRYRAANLPIRAWLIPYRRSSAGSKRTSNARRMRRTPALPRRSKVLRAVLRQPKEALPPSPLPQKTTLRQKN